MRCSDTTTTAGPFTTWLSAAAEVSHETRPRASKFYLQHLVITKCATHLLSSHALVQCNLPQSFIALDDMRGPLSKLLCIGWPASATAQCHACIVSYLLLRMGHTHLHRRSTLTFTPSSGGTTFTSPIVQLRATSSGTVDFGFYGRRLSLEEAQKSG